MGKRPGSVREDVQYFSRGSLPSCARGCAVFLEGFTPLSWQEKRTTLEAREKVSSFPLPLGKALKSGRGADRETGAFEGYPRWAKHPTRNRGEPRPPASPQTPGCIQGGVSQGCCPLAFLHQHRTSSSLQEVQLLPPSHSFWVVQAAAGQVSKLPIP